MEFKRDGPAGDGGLSAAEYAARRTLGRFITSKSFPLAYGRDSLVGRPTKTAWQVLAEDYGEGDLEGQTSMTESLYESPAGRVQIQARVVGEVGDVQEIRLQRIEGANGPNPQLTEAIRLDGSASARLIDFCSLLSAVDPSEPSGFRIDEAMIRQIAADPERLQRIYAEDPQALRALIESDINATDVLALQARRGTVEKFERMLEDESYFIEVSGSRGPEAQWQHFFEENPWLLGVGLSAHLFTSWDSGRLERYVAGSSVAGVGKESDAFMETAGAIRSLVYAEIKRHDDDLLAKAEYRSGTWAVSPAVAGGVAQVHTTVQRAQEDIGRELERKVDGFKSGEVAFNFAPRSYLVIGSLRSLTRSGAAHEEKYRSFELFRRSIASPEILTYDEVLARAKGFLDLAQRVQ